MVWYKVLSKVAFTFHFMYNGPYFKINFHLKGGIMGKQKWERIHELKAYLIYRHIKNISEDKDFKGYISFDSLQMKVADFRSIETGKGLDSVSENCKSMFAEFKGKLMQEIEKAISQQGKNTDKKRAE